MEIKYQLFEAENLLVQKYSGQFSMEEFVAYARFSGMNFASKPIKKVLLDFRDLHMGNYEDFNETLDKVVKVRERVNENEFKNREVTFVIWVEKPMPTAVAHLFTANFSDKNYHYALTAESVVDILKLPKHLANIDKIVENIENTFDGQ